MPDGLKHLYLSDSAQAAEFLAAAYNGGTSRVKKAFNAWGADWGTSHLDEIQRLNVQNEALIDDIEAMKAKLKRTTDAKQKKKLENGIWSQRAVRKKVLARLNSLNSVSLKMETVGYVAKCRKVYAMLTSGVFATPAAPSGALPQQAAPAVLASAPAAEVPVAGQTICFANGVCAAVE